MELLRGLKLPSDVRANTSEAREGGGVDAPDLSIYDDTGDRIVVPVEVKLPSVELDDLARSEDRNDQIGRYLAQTRVTLISNVRGIGLLTIKEGWTGHGPVPPAQRVLERVVGLWPSRSAFLQGKPTDGEAARDLSELVEDAFTRFAAIRTPQMLARVLARQARHAKASLPADLGGTVEGLREDFGKSLGITFVGDEGEEFFRSSLIQTVFYALFAGWALGNARHEKQPLRWRDLAEHLTIPVLGGLFHEINHPARLRALQLEPWLDRAEATLARVDTATFFARLSTPRLDEPLDPARQAANAIIYFYEPFLESFDPNLRKQLGVWYTPPEIVRYQVRRIDQLLRSELGCRQGLADPDVIVLDPACGTGAYLIEVLLCINERLVQEGAGAERGRRLVDALCRRVIGFEILTAPFVIAHLQLLLALSSLGVEPKTDKRLAVFLTNALTGWDGSEQLKLHFPDLAVEHEAARVVKRDARIIVVLGNPPYNRFADAPMAEESDLVDHYKGIVRDKQGKQDGQSRLFADWGIKKHLLDDLYIRFFRLAEKRIGEVAEHGIVSFISNSSYLAGRSHPIMRGSLLRCFNDVWIDNLHGNRLASERTPQGDSCETIFSMEGGGPGIKVGTCIGTLVKHRDRPRKRGVARVHYRDFWGRAAAKRRALEESLTMDEWDGARRKAAAATAAGPRMYESFAPTMENRWKLAPRTDNAGYEAWPAIDELFASVFQGVNPNRGLDGSLIDVDREVLERRMQAYYSDLPDAVFANAHPVLFESRARYDPATVRALLKRTSQYAARQIVPYVVFPLDCRWLYYEPESKLLNEKRPELWRSLRGNEFLVSVPQARRASESLPLFADALFDLHLHDRGSVAFPAEVEEAPHEADLFSGARLARGARVANLDSSAWSSLSNAWGLSGDLHGALAKAVARSLLRACLALCHAPTYQEDHRESLAQDFARVPIPVVRALFDRVAGAGDEVAALLNPLADASDVVRRLLGRDAASLGVPSGRSQGQIAEGQWTVTVAYYGASKGRWAARSFAAEEPSRPEWGDQTGDLWINDDVFFRNVPERVWRYELGGYPVLKKWLGYRDAKRAGGRELTMDEVQHFRGMIQRIAALLVLQPQLDELYAAAAAAPMRFDA